MKKIVLILLTNLLLLPIIGSFSLVKINALSRYDYGYYPMGCSLGQYEVSYIEDDGKLTTISCFDSFADAKQDMKNKGKDYVVRNGYSPAVTKIVAMLEGRAYAYPGRSGTVTMNIYENQPNIKSSDAYTYVTENYEMNYIDTTYMSNKQEWLGTGYVLVNLNGFTGYCDSENLDLVPSKYIDKQIPIILGGNNTYNGEEPYEVIMQYNYYEIVKNDNYYDLAFNYYYAWPGKNKIAKGAVIYVDNAASYPELEVGKKYYSDNGYDFYSKANFAKDSYVCTAFNYYQFLPLRSKSNISASTFDSFLIKTKGSNTKSVLKNQGSVFIDSQNEYGCNALIIYAMATQESAYGESGYAINKNNLFGWAAYDSDPDNASYYDSVSKCIKQHMGYNLRGYLDISDSRFYGSYVGNKGNGFNVKYSSDPYWGLKIASIAYKIDKYSNNNNGKLTDYNSVSYALLNDNNSYLYKNENTNDVYYRPSQIHNYHYIYTLPIYSLNSSVGKVASTNPISNGSICTDHVLTKYDFNNSIAYVKANEISLLFGDVVLENESEIIGSEGDAFTSLREVKLVNNVLTINGVGGITNNNFIDTNSIEHIIAIYDLKDNTKVYTFTATDIDSNGYSLNDGFDYKYTGFNIDIDLSDLPLSSYAIRLKTKYLNIEKETVLRNSDLAYRLMYSNYNGINYKASTNSLFNYRLELDIDSLPSELDASLIHKPSYRDSLISLESIKIEDNKIDIRAHGMIYYLNYTDNENINYEVYLIENNTNYTKLDTTNYACEVSYTDLFNSTYQLDNICFKASGSINDLNGNYTLLVKISNGEYTDIVEIANRANEQLPSYTNEIGTYNFYTSSIRSRIMFEARKA